MTREFETKAHDLKLNNKQLETSVTPQDARNKQIKRLQVDLPTSHEAYTDKYFLRSNEILKAEGLNPIVRAQVFLRKGDAELRGIDKAIAVIRKYSQLEENGGRIKALNEGDHFTNGENVLEIEGPIQEIMELETMYLGVVAEQTTLANGGPAPEAEAITARTKQITELAGDRPVIYLGARHWGYDKDVAIAKASYAGGITGAATDIAAEQIGQKGIGTTPHVIENVMAYKYGKDNAVVEATKAFDRVIDPAVPRIALIDYNNKEIKDSIDTANALNGRLSSVRVDTCGENVAQGAVPTQEILDSLVDSIKSGRSLKIEDIHDQLEEIFTNDANARKSEIGNWLSVANRLTQSEKSISPENLKYWCGTGVTISGVYELRKALDEAGHKDVGIVLTSGFGKPQKVAAFVEAEEILGVKLFDMLGVGGLYEARYSTMDVVHVSDSMETLDENPCSKVGRYHKPNPRLQELKPDLAV